MVSNTALKVSAKKASGKKDASKRKILIIKDDGTIVEIPESKALGMRIKNKVDLMKSIRAGFPTKSIDSLRGQLALSQEEMIKFVDIKNSTLARRKESGKLNNQESDRVFRYAHILELAKEMMLGDNREASNWLKQPSPILADQSPLEYASTEAGARDVERYINRIMDGTYS